MWGGKGTMVTDAEIQIQKRMYETIFEDWKKDYLKFIAKELRRRNPYTKPTCHKDAFGFFCIGYDKACDELEKMCEGEKEQ